MYTILYVPAFIIAELEFVCAGVCEMWVPCLHTSLYFCSVLASLVSQASTVALLLCRVVSRWERSAGGSDDRLLNWPNKAEDRQGITNTSQVIWSW